ncbi:MAG: LacI family DNA-binding transcriptional regulator [Opitutaceae bacterium]|jgi:LacI family transcriptional regulator
MKTHQPVRSPTQSDIAKVAGVTAATVSMALRNDPRITPSTQEKVRQAAKSLHYKPDPILSALVARRDLNRKHRAYANIAALLDDRWDPKIHSQWLNSFIAGMQASSARFGYNLDIIHLQRDLGSKRQPDRLLHSRGIRGVILMPLFNQELIAQLQWSRYSAVGLGHPPQSLPINRVGSDAFQAMHIACLRLRELGYRRIGLINHMIAEQRLRYEWLGAISKEHFLPDSGLTILQPHLPTILEPDSLLDWVRKGKPDAVITNHGHIFHWLNAAGFSVPEKLGLVLLNRDFSEPVGAAGLSQHLDASGEAAVELLHTLLLRGETGFPSVPREVLIRPHWVDGFTLRKQSPAPPSPAARKRSKSPKS